MSDTPPVDRPRRPLAAHRAAGLIDRLRRGPAPEENLDDDEARAAGMLAIDRYRRPRPS